MQQAYLKLTERQGFIESILANFQSGIIVTDLNFRILFMNPAAKKFLSASAEAVTATHLSVLCPTIAAALRDGKQSDEMYCSACARKHVIRFKMFDMKGKDGLVNGHIFSFADVITPKTLHEYSWTKEVSELEAVIERILNLCNDEANHEELPAAIRRATSTSDGFPRLGELRSLSKVKDDYIEYVLRLTGNNHSRSAAILGISRSTLLAGLKKKG